MKQSLQLKVSQQLAMTPQLQQAIRLLQLSTLDLQQEIQTALESNPLLEVSDEDGSEASAKDKPEEATPEANGADVAEPETAGAEASASDTEWGENIPEDLPVDTQWDDIYQPTTASPVGSAASDDFDFDSRNSAGESLQDHLLWQLNMDRLSEEDLQIGLAIIDAIDNKGRLTQTPEEILQGFSGVEGIDIEEIMAMLHRIQNFDPPGIAAQDLRECLLIQLRQLPPDTPWRDEAEQILKQHLDLLASHDYNQLRRRSKLSEEDLIEVIALIRTLHPNPGETIGEDDTEYVIPDVFVRKVEGSWRVELNPDIAPKLRINANYASMAKSGGNAADNSYIRDNLQEARWFLKSLQSRNETLMKVASKIVEFQRGFLEHGPEAMKPLILHDIAEAVEMHESTISRVTTQKFMHTPRGIFELKYFFSSHVSTSSGGECSSTAIRALIKKLVAAENPRKPLSDSKISALLEEQGIKVARRTIAKYRESLVIPPSNERKRLV